MTERFAAFVSVDFDAAQSHPRFHCDQAADHITLRLAGLTEPIHVYVTGTVDELHTFAAQIIYALLAHTEDLHHAGAAAREVIDQAEAAADHDYHAPHSYSPKTCDYCASLPNQGRPADTFRQNLS